MSVKKRDLLDQARQRRGVWKQQRKMVRCQNMKCQALNSPNAKSCWKCGEHMES